MLKSIAGNIPPMLVSQFDYDLPDKLIAQRPLQERTTSRLLSVPVQGAFRGQYFYDLPGIIESGDLLVFNNSRVIPARLYGQKSSGGRVELLIERIEGERQALCHLRVSKIPKAGIKLLFDGGASADVLGREDDLFRLNFEISGSLIDYLVCYGHMPLPPYIRRSDDLLDKVRYQTVYAREAGAVAAPTAGLHFDETLLHKLHIAGVKTCFITLHVGTGTFQPVRVDNIAEHQMHSEWIDVSRDVCEQIAATRKEGGKIIAVGTTVVRSLETAAASGELQPYQGDTRIFITPGYSFKVVDAMITNFHLPRSTLLMLVCAFGGYARVMQAYNYAIAQNYRFYSYGDAMYLVHAKGK